MFNHRIRLTLIPSLCFVALALLASCSSSSTGPAGEADPGTIVASVNGRSFTTLTMTTSATYTDQGSGNIMIQGNTGGTSSDAISLIILGAKGTGTFPIGGGANIANVASYTNIKIDMSNPSAAKTSTYQAPYDDKKVGEIVITELTDELIKGTFSFEAMNTTGDKSIVKITDGSFNIKFNK